MSIVNTRHFTYLNNYLTIILYRSDCGCFPCRFLLLKCQCLFIYYCIFRLARRGKRSERGDETFDGFSPRRRLHNGGSIARRGAERARTAAAQGACAEDTTAPIQQPVKRANRELALDWARLTKTRKIQNATLLP